MAGLSNGSEALVARDAELQHLLWALSAVGQGGGRLVLLSGEPGIGKTRPAREVLAHALAAGNVVLVGHPGVLAWMEGRTDEAAQCFGQFADDARRKRDFQGVTVGLFELIALRLQIARAPEVEAASRETLALLRRWVGTRGLAAGPIAETLVRLGTADAEAVLSELERLVDESGELVARPSLLRVRALLTAQQHAVGDALEALSASAAHARSQHALVELAQTDRP